MATTTIWVTRELKEKIHAKADEFRLNVHAGLVASLAIKAWTEGFWQPGPDITGLKDCQLFLRLEDTAFIMAMKMRQQTGASVSPVYRRALQDWVDGKWEIGLVRDESKRPVHP